MPAAPHPRTLHLVLAALSALVGWPAALWASTRARRRLRANGPGLVMALRQLPRLQ